MDISKIKSIYPNAIVGIIDILKQELDKEEWSDENKCHFLAQCAHESANFRVVKENLNYSMEGLMKVFPKYFKFGYRDPYEYQRNPEKIANLVYANRMGNGDIKTGDGYRYRGRGLIQITGKNNYTKCLEYLGMKDPSYLETLEGAVRSAIWFWKVNVLFTETNIKIITKRVNGGLNGLEDRINHFNKIKKCLQ